MWSEGWVGMISQRGSEPLKAGDLLDELKVDEE